MAAIEKALAGDEGDKIRSSDGRAWFYFALRLMEGTKPDAQTLSRVRALRGRADEAKARNSDLSVPMNELCDAADAVLSANSSP